MNRTAVSPLLRGTFLLVLTLLAVLPPAAGQAPPPAKDELPAATKAKLLKPAPGDDDLQKLLKERYNAAVREAQAWFKEYQAGNHRIPSDALFEAERRVLDAELELSDKSGHQIRVREKYVELAKEFERILQGRFDAGRIMLADLEKARYEHLDAEIKLLRERRKLDAGKSK